VGSLRLPRDIQLAVQCSLSIFGTFFVALTVPEDNMFVFRGGEEETMGHYVDV
jgi:hypothetical protein